MQDICERTENLHQWKIIFRNNISR